MAQPEYRELIDPARPVAVLMLAVLHFVPDDGQASAALRWWRGAVARGSYLAITHAQHLPGRPDLVEAADLYNASVAPFAMRTADQLAPLLGDWEIIPPGIVPATRWPRHHPLPIGDGPDPPVLAVVARKPS
jgi:hypothetical protein